MSKCPSCGYKAAKKVAYLGGTVLTACPQCEAVLRANPWRGRVIVLVGNIIAIAAVVGVYLATRSFLWTLAGTFFGCMFSIWMPFIAGDFHEWEVVEGAKATWRTRQANNQEQGVCPHCKEDISFAQYMDFVADSTRICPHCYTRLIVDVASRRHWCELLVWIVFVGCFGSLTMLNIGRGGSSFLPSILKMAIMYSLIVAFETTTFAVRWRFAIYQIDSKRLSEQEFEAQVLAELRERQAELRK